MRFGARAIGARREAGTVQILGKECRCRKPVETRDGRLSDTPFTQKKKIL